jgi:hypothetical protein
VEEPDSEQSALRDLISNDRIEIDIDQWQVSRVLGTLGDYLLVSASRPTGEDLLEVGVLLIDAAAHNARWIWAVTDLALGVPVVSFPSPDGSRLLIAGQNPDDDVIRYVILGAEGSIQVRTGELEAASGLIAVGWFDDERIVMRGSDGSVSMLDLPTGLDPATGLVSPLTLPTTVGSLARVWAVGDGAQLLADTSTSLIRFTLDSESEVRVLADQCEVGLIGDIGWRRP